MINIGSKIPNFTIINQEGEEIESEDLIGNAFVLYFYPQDDTPGCTKEACSFRDNMDQLEELDTIVIGVSPDPKESHQKFIHKYGLNFALLCDEDYSLARKFGVVQEKEQNGKRFPCILRSTFVVDSQGIIRWMEKPVNLEGHTERVIEAIKELA